MLKDNRKTLIQNYKCELKNMRLKSGITANTMALIFDCKPNHLKNFEHGLCNDMYLTMFYINSFILKKDYDISKRKNKHYIKQFLLSNLPEITSHDIKTISDIYNVPDSYIKLFYAVTDYIEEYIIIILVDYFLMGGKKYASN